MQERSIGKLVQIIGPVLDIRFPGGHLPDLLNAIEIKDGDRTIVCEAAQQLGDDVVRCIAMSSTVISVSLFLTIRALLRLGRLPSNLTSMTGPSTRTTLPTLFSAITHTSFFISRCLQQSQ